MPAIQIRHVPDEVHRRLKERAAAAGQSLSEHALATLAQSLERPTIVELVNRVEQRGPIGSDIDVVGALSAERDAR